MGNKKQKQDHVQQSMSQMVSKAAIAQLAPHIENYVTQHISNLGSQLAVKQAENTEALFSRIILLESILMERFGYTKEAILVLKSSLEDAREQYVESTETVKAKDLVRLEIKTKTNDQADFQGSSRLKIYDIGSGRTLGAEIESEILGMAVNGTKVFNFGENKEMTAEVKINRISSPNSGGLSEDKP